MPLWVLGGCVWRLSFVEGTRTFWLFPGWGGRGGADECLVPIPLAIVPDSDEWQVNTYNDGLGAGKRPIRTEKWDSVRAG